MRAVARAGAVVNAATDVGFDRAETEAELAALVARTGELRQLLADDEWRRRREAAFAVNNNPCSWCGSANARPELGASWSRTGRYICCTQGVPCPCRMARILGETPEEFATVARARQLLTVREQFTGRTA